MKERWRTRQRTRMLQRSPSAEHPLNSEALRCQIFRRPARGRSRRCGCRRNRLFAPSRGCRHDSASGRGYFGCQSAKPPLSWSQTRPELAVAIMAGPSSNACGRDCHFLVAAGARIDAVCACAHHPDAEGLSAHPDHPARKPNPGMLLQAASDFGVDLKGLWLVSDKANDIEAASAGHCRRSPGRDRLRRSLPRNWLA